MSSQALFRKPATGVDADVAGTWTVTGGSQAGYRVREQLANLPAESDAVGRTSDVTGSITIESDRTIATPDRRDADRRHHDDRVQRIPTR